MKTRGNNPKRADYKYYGGKGIKVCDRWSSFEAFLEDMEDPFQEGLTLDRRDGDGDYCPENCKWSTKEEQANNMSNNLNLTYKGVVYTEAELSRAFGIKRTTVQARRNRGWSVKEIVEGRSDKNEVLLTYEGVKYNQATLARMLGTSAAKLQGRRDRGWTEEEVVYGKPK